MSFTLFSDAPAVISIPGPQRPGDVNPDRHQPIHGAEIVQRNSLFIEAKLFRSTLANKGWSPSQWFASLGNDWSEEERRLYVAMQYLDAESEHRTPSPDLQFMGMCYFP